VKVRIALAVDLVGGSALSKAEAEVREQHCIKRLWLLCACSMWIIVLDNY